MVDKRREFVSCYSKMMKKRGKLGGLEQNTTTAIAELAIELADAPSTANLFQVIGDKLKVITDAVATCVSRYEGDAEDLVVEYIALDRGLLSAVHRILGRPVIGMRMPVSAETLEEMRTEIIARPADIAESTFGVIPKVVSSAILTALGVGELTIMAFQHAGTVVGTALIVQRRGQRPLDWETAHAFARVAAVGLRRKRAEEELRRSEERLKLVLEGSNDGFWDWNVPGSKIFFSPRCAEMLGFRGDELPSDFADWEKLFHPEDQATMAAARAMAFGTRATDEVECRMLSKSGEWKWVLWRGRAVGVDADGSPLRFAGTLTDISGRKAAEQEKADLEAQLRQAQKMEAVGTLAGGIAHDFNNLLTNIIGYGSLVLDSLNPDDPSKPDAEEIVNSANRAALLTQQLLAFSRKQTLQPKVVNLNAVVTDFDQTLRRLITADIELVGLLDPQLECVRADPGQLQQVLLNLVVNARDAMPDGGKLTIQTANFEPDEAFAEDHAEVQSGPYIRLTVSDTGMGMDDKTRDRAFEPFFTTKGRGKGTGLGLSTVYGIVRQSGGCIAIDSAKGRGTRFDIYLPRVSGDAEEIARTPAAQLPLRGTETVLIVEDEPQLRQVATRVLRNLGYRVLEASNGEEALTVAGEHSGGDIHLLLTDVVMPLVGGPKLAKRLKAMYPNAAVLFMSGYTDDAVVDEKGLGFEVTFLQKPFAPDMLAKTVRAVLDRRREE